ncbi:CBD9-like protein [Phaeosphaeriaceae sp. SRC1lsM3a]|nr:CBD9-like protein [Stagonospora sp. SRC1lsM3a]
MHCILDSRFVYVLALFMIALVGHIPRAAGAAVSTFIYPAGKGNLTFALSATNTGDIYIHLSAPVAYQWVGVGTGSEMDGSVMFILYENSERNGVTLSPRLSSGHFEPGFSEKIDCGFENDTAHHGSIDQRNGNGYFSANIHCKNITALGKGDGKLDLSNAKQPFIYAWGPTDSPMLSSSNSASMKRHDAYGNFWLDMTKATSSDSAQVMFPTGASLFNSTNSGTDGQAESDGDKVGPAHAALMLVAFAVIFPLGAILLRFLDSVKAHYIAQSIGVLAAIVGVGVGIYLSKMYNHSRNVSSGHQVFGLILLALLFSQWAIGFYHHFRFRQHKRPTAYGKVHLVAGPAIILGGIINGFTGFNFSGEPHNNVYYGAVVAVIIVVVLVLLGWKRWSSRKQNKGRRMSNGEDLTQESYPLNTS